MRAPSLLHFKACCTVGSWAALRVVLVVVLVTLVVLVVVVMAVVVMGCLRVCVGGPVQDRGLVVWGSDRVGTGGQQATMLMVAYCADRGQC